MLSQSRCRSKLSSRHEFKPPMRVSIHTLILLRDLTSEERVRNSEVQERRKYAEASRKKLHVGPQFSNQRQRNMARQEPNLASPLVVSPERPRRHSRAHWQPLCRGAPPLTLPVCRYSAAMEFLAALRNERVRVHKSQRSFPGFPAIRVNFRIADHPGAYLLFVRTGAFLKSRG